VTDEPSFWSVAGTQRAHRAFTDEPVDDALVERVLTTAAYAPSAENTQPWEFVVVRDPELRDQIGELTLRAWGPAQEFSRPRITPELFAEVEQGATGGVSAAPVLVIVAGDTSRCVASVIPASIFPAVQNFLLAAQALGLGSALTTLTTGYADELRAIVDLPEHLLPIAVLPLGWPAKPKGPPKRKPVAGKTHRDRFGSPW
jgi:nitroreductase